MENIIILYNDCEFVNKLRTSFDCFLLQKLFRRKDDVANYTFGPKEGDTPDRAKYSQIKDDSPELVEYIGMQNLIKALKENLGLKAGKLVFGFEDGTSRNLPWGALDDVVMGGVSESQFRIVPNGGETGGPTSLFTGMLTKLYFVTSTNGS
ncbi:putative complex I intermediate-associated protein 30 [Helianthus annuus]|nr:putative NADH:ubiquinone oxidoreductase intermediate-associated protein [Helianthus annuus]KAJ0836065.1 putative complex I intermediate-associated protein 30 [Helianthus annuus]